jgi:SAM-dependent methyltransferase
MKTGFAFNFIQEVFSRAYAMTTGNDPYPLHSVLRHEQDRLAPRTVLDLGCGSGRFALSGCEYVGIDPNPKYIAYCRQHHTGRFEQMSGELLEFADGRFAMVLSFSVGHHLPDPSLDRLFSEARRVLADDGVFLFADVIRPIVGWQPAARLLEWLDEGDSFRTEAQYVELLAPHFAVVHREEIVDQFYRTLVLRCRKA